MIFNYPANFRYCIFAIFAKCNSLIINAPTSDSLITALLNFQMPLQLLDYQ